MRYKRIMPITLLLLSLSCTEKETPAEALLVQNSKQPTIPIYDQLLLKGDVLSVASHIVSYGANGGKGVAEEYVGFDEKRNVVEMFWDGTQIELGPETHCISFQSVTNSYAFFDFPTSWTSIRSVIESDGTIALERQWDEWGHYVRMRFTQSGNPVLVEGLNDFELEKYLYDENGYPRYTFTLDGDKQLTICTENEYSQLDEEGNATKIHVVTPNGEYDIFRTIRYR